jgi:hypothetical protein
VTITVNTPDGGTAQFPDGTPPSAMTSALQAKFGGPSGATAQADPASKMSGIGRTLENALTLGGADWAYSKLPGMPSLATQQAQTEAARQSVPAAIRYPAEIGAYAVGPGKLLGPAAAAMTGGPIAAGVAEGAMAGGLSSGFGSNFDPGSTATGAVTGGALGGAAGGIGKGVAKLGATPGSIDPAAAIAATKTTRDTLYGQLQNIPVGANSLKNAYASATLTPGLEPSVTPAFNTLIGRQLAQVDAGGISANDVADFAKDLRAQATSNGDQILAGKISDNLISALPSEAQQTLQAANEAHQQYMMAQNLGKWGRITGEGGSIGQAPLTEAENFYSDDPEKYKILAGLAKGDQGQSKATYALGHLAAHALGVGGYTLGGFPGSMIGEALGYLVAKPAISKAMKGVDQRAKLSGIQAAYPQMTGQPLTGAQQGPQVGDAIKNLMLGSAY